VAAARIIVIGAGVGGLTAALALAARGHAVTVCERAADVGGKLRTIRVAGHDTPIDAGPTVFTMRWVFDEIFGEAGLAFEDVVRLEPAALLARHAWRADEHLDLYADIDQSADAIAAFAGPAEARGYRNFCDTARSAYESLRSTFIAAPKPSVTGLVSRLGVSGLAKFSRASPFSTLARELERHFRDARLRQLFGRYATYVGSSPYAAPATLALIAHVEQAGVWFADGGMHALARALAAAGIDRGVEIRTNTRVAEILTSGGRASGVRLDDDEQIDADAVIFNGDAAALPLGYLGAGARTAASSEVGTRSLSAVTFAMAARTSGFPLVRHSVFFSNDYAAEFNDLFALQRMPQDPTVYVCAQDRTGANGAVPADGERLLCLINAPANGDDARWAAPEEIERCRERMIRRLTACGLALQSEPRSEVATTPRDFAALFPGRGGALYGPASHGWMASFQRPAARTRLSGLYLAGGSVHPGAGVPMAALSGRMAAHSLLEDLASTRTWVRAGTPGGTSTG